MLGLIRRGAALIGMLVLGLCPLYTQAAPETPLTTRFVQGSFDILLPNGWVAVVDETGTELFAEGPGFQMFSVSVAWQDNQVLFDFHEASFSALDANPQFQVSMVLDSGEGSEKSRRTIMEVSGLPEYATRTKEARGSPFHRVQISRPGSAHETGVFAAFVVRGSDEAFENSVRFLDSVLDSLKVLEPQSLGPSIYQPARNNASRTKQLQPADIVGKWEGEDVLGDFGYVDSNPTVALLWSLAPDLDLLPNGRYSKRWAHIDFDIGKGGTVLRIDHRENGNWSLRQGQLHLMPESYEGQIQAQGAEPEFYNEKVNVIRQYDVILLDEALILRGVCAEYQMLPDCVDPYSGELRTLGFLTKKVD